MHTSVVDAVSGAIYVIGGTNGNIYSTNYFNDVWASTDGGARAGLGRGGGRGEGLLLGNPGRLLRGILQGYMGYSGVHGVLRGS